MRFLEMLGKIIVWPIKFVFKIILKFVKWLLLAPIRWISGLIFIAVGIFLLIKFVL